MNSSKDPLFALVAEDAKSIDRARIADFLTQYVVIDKESKGLTFRGAFNAIGDNGRKLEIVLLASLARSLIFPGESAALAPKEIIAMQVLAEGSVKSGLRGLLKSGSIKQNAEGKYHVPTYRIDEIISVTN